ncbi:hypothetical protein CC1G_12823 [Coprinopsis cinerea okayama7|uniref:Uncharacterized protein n=1 Tax=Coprinopsis cinerea (strain Okayama-7 / 130 / ATCC MYA-4618 / FGSC 9003) TaxID=240176 RepID=A8PD78_COPC7|nr:hypothetical protein CC1G_12823 [Coprinopsis cinerea okayama7\|eukprot:XP_001840550.2 hypothetical protein CC1G_12823 [Coprinopsis cinerea okayama7\
MTAIFPSSASSVSSLSFAHGNPSRSHQRILATSPNDSSDSSDAESSPLNVWIPRVHAPGSTFVPTKQRKPFARPGIPKDLLREEFVDGLHVQQRLEASRELPVTPTPPSRRSARGPFLMPSQDRPRAPLVPATTPETNTRSPAPSERSSPKSLRDKAVRKHSSRKPKSAESLVTSNLADLDADISADEESLAMEKAGPIEIFLEHAGEGRKLITDIHLVRAIVQQWNILNHRHHSQPDDDETRSKLEKSEWNILTLKCVLIELRRPVALALLGRFLTNAGEYFSEFSRNWSHSFAYS